MKKSNFFEFVIISVIIITASLSSCRDSRTSHASGNAPLEVRDVVHDSIGSKANYEKGNEYYKKFFEANLEERDSDDLQNAFLYWKKSADCGYPVAQYCVGICYYRGLGVRKDYGKAQEYFTLASAQGVADASYWLGLCYYYGNLYGCSSSARFINKPKALRYFKRAADVGHAGGAYYLGVHYYEIGVNAQKCEGKAADEYFKESYDWFVRAADAGDVRACFYLGLFYYAGRYVNQDLTKAYQYFDFAAKHGDSSAQYFMGLYFENGYGNVVIDLSIAREWYERAAQGGNLDAAKKLQSM